MLHAFCCVSAGGSSNCSLGLGCAQLCERWDGCARHVRVHKQVNREVWLLCWVLLLFCGRLLPVLLGNWWLLCWSG